MVVAVGVGAREAAEPASGAHRASASALPSPVPAQGVGTAHDIDVGMRLGTNQPMGPLALADLIGLDTCLAVMRVLHEGMGDTKYRCRRAASVGHSGGVGKNGMEWPGEGRSMAAVSPKAAEPHVGCPAGPARCWCSMWMPAGWAERRAAACTRMAASAAAAGARSPADTPSSRAG